MGSRRRLVGALTSTIAALTLLTFAGSAGAGALDACAQRVIRDWYSGGRVDNVYPLRCYSAAIRALPSDVLQYSDADQDIRRALAFARRGRSDPGDGAAASSPATSPAPTIDAQAQASNGHVAPRGGRRRRGAAPPVGRRTGDGGGERERAVSGRSRSPGSQAFCSCPALQHCSPLAAADAGQAGPIEWTAGRSEIFPAISLFFTVGLAP